MSSTAPVRGRAMTLFSRPVLPMPEYAVTMPLDIDLGTPPLDIDLQALAAEAARAAGRDPSQQSAGWRTEPAVHYTRR